ncbi:MAG TPA: histidine phosphatase family protein [Caulobacteraceae bacterium]|nr:histidine phosphatase family protein [Caulobacteraceae bacterium]
MAPVWLIRHAMPTSGWGGEDDDPGLEGAGRAQALAAAEALAALAPTAIVSSPLRRCLETAQPLADRLGLAVDIDPAVGEIPTPAGLAREARSPWLRRALAGRWTEIEGDLDYAAWRAGVRDAVARRPGAAIFSHFVAINAVCSLLAKDDRVVAVRPDYASITTLEAGPDGALALIESGAEAVTRVL